MGGQLSQPAEIAKCPLSMQAGEETPTDTKMENLTHQQLAVPLHLSQLKDLPHVQKLEQTETTKVDETEAKKLEQKPVEDGEQHPTFVDLVKTMESHAEARGGKLLATFTNDESLTVRWCCKTAHTWRSTWDDVQKGQWCPTCDSLKIDVQEPEKKQSPITTELIEEMKQHAKARGGKYLGVFWEGAKPLPGVVENGPKFKWTCDKEHTWVATWGSTRDGRWCPNCAKQNKGRDFTDCELMKMRAMQHPQLEKQIYHCLAQLRRFPREAKTGARFRTAQFAFNLGRVQELLMPSTVVGTAGRDCWWRRFEPLIEASDFDGMDALATSISRQFGHHE